MTTTMIQRLHAIPEGTGIMYRWRNIQTNQELDRVMGFIGVVSDAAVYIDFSNHCLLAHIKVLRPSGETLGELYSTSEEEVKLAVAGKIERICDDHRLASCGRSQFRNAIVVAPSMSDAAAAIIQGVQKFTEGGLLVPQPLDSRITDWSWNKIYYYIGATGLIVAPGAGGAYRNTLPPYSILPDSNGAPLLRYDLRTYPAADRHPWVYILGEGWVRRESTWRMRECTPPE